MRLKILALGSAFLWFFLDFYSKGWALQQLAGQSIEVTSFLNWRLAFNCGAAFSFLAKAGGWQKYLFLGIALVVSVYLLYLILRGGLRRLEYFAFAGIIGGALGNAYDRAVYGCVVDFIDVHAWGKHYPTFNVADIAICSGVALIWLAILTEKKT